MTDLRRLQASGHDRSAAPGRVSACLGGGTSLCRRSCEPASIRRSGLSPCINIHRCSSLWTWAAGRRSTGSASACAGGNSWPFSSCCALAGRARSPSTALGAVAQFGGRRRSAAELLALVWPARTRPAAAFRHLFETALLSCWPHSGGIVIAVVTKSYDRVTSGQPWPLQPKGDPRYASSSTPTRVLSVSGVPARAWPAACRQPAGRRQH